MYANYFGLSELPFSIAPNPQYLYMSTRHREALAHLSYGLQADGGFILLTGEVGTGKTTLCRQLLNQIPVDVDTAFVLNPMVSATELLSTIADEFGFSCYDHQSTKALTDALNSFLLKQNQADRKSVLIIDEAQNLPRDVLEQLRLLTNLETDERKLLQIILLGQPELNQTLEHESLRQFNQRVTSRYHLEPLDLDDTEAYIRHRISVARGTANLFTDSAVRKLYSLTGGIPRLINLICDRALLGAYAEDRRHVTLSIVRKAAEEVTGKKVSKPLKLVIATAATAIIATVGGIIYLSTPEESSSTLTTVTAAQTSKPAAQVSLPSLDQNQIAQTPISGHKDLNTAWHDLFALWGAAFEDRQSNPCQLSTKIGLICMYKAVDWGELIKINRPVIVQIDDHYLTLSHVGDDGVTLFSGEKQFELTNQEFLDRFNGEISMLWRAPPAYREPLKVDDEGAAVDWLVVQMAVIEGEVPPLATGFTFNQQLASRVKDFQASVGLAPDGIVDPITWIHINSVEAINTPTLKSSGRG